MFAYILVSLKGLSMLRAVKYVVPTPVQKFKQKHAYYHWQSTVLPKGSPLCARSFLVSQCTCLSLKWKFFLKINHAATWNNRAFRTYHAILEEIDETVVQIEVFCCYGHGRKLQIANFRRQMMVGLWQHVLPCRLTWLLYWSMFQDVRHSQTLSANGNGWRPPLWRLLSRGRRVLRWRVCSLRLIPHPQPKYRRMIGTCKLSVRVLAQQEGFHHCGRVRRAGIHQIYIFTNKVLIWQKTRTILQTHLLFVLFPILWMSQYVTEYLVWGWRVSIWGLIWLCPVQNLLWKLYCAFSHLSCSCEDCTWNIAIT